MNGNQLKLKGMKRAADKYMIELQTARIYAVEHAKRHGTVTADDTYLALLANGETTELGNAWGALFKGCGFVWTGEWKMSTRPSNRSRYIRIWRLK